MYLSAICQDAVKNERVLVLETEEHNLMTLTINPHTGKGTYSIVKGNDINRTGLQVLDMRYNDTCSYQKLYDVDITTDGYTRYNKISKIEDAIYLIEAGTDIEVISKWGEPVNKNEDCVIYTLKENKELRGKLISK